MESYAQTLVKQPDGTQGIATVEFKSGSSSEPVKMVGCAIHVSKKDKGHRTILKVEDKRNTGSQVKYFIFVPWFKSSRPEIDESTSIEIKLHRYKKKENKKTFSVNVNDSKEIFEKYDSDEYMVIPCPRERNYQKSSFLKKWSSDLLLYNNSSQVSSSTSNSKCPGCSSPSQGQGHSSQNQEARDDRFHGFKKEEENFKYHGFHQEPALEEQGVLLIMSNCKVSKCERYVIGCYKKENDNTEKYCFLLRGLERIAEQLRSEVENGNPNQSQPQSASDNHDQEQASIRSGKEERDNTTPERCSARSGEGRDNNHPEQPPSSSADHAETNNHDQEQASIRSGKEKRDNPNQDQPPSASGDHAERDNHDQEQASIRSGKEERDNTNPEQHSARSGEGRDNNHPEKPSSVKGEEERNNHVPLEPPPPPSDTQGRGNTNPEQLPPQRNEDRRNNPLDQHPPLEDLSLECEDGRMNSSPLVVSGQKSSVASSCEAEKVTKIKKRELILNKYSPKVADIPYDVQHRVALLLNIKQNVKGNDWRKVASRPKIGLDSCQINNLLTKDDPMREVFQVMSTLSVKVDEFVDILFEIDREDVVEEMYEMANQTQQ